MCTNYAASPKIVVSDCSPGGKIWQISSQTDFCRTTFVTLLGFKYGRAIAYFALVSMLVVVIWPTLRVVACLSTNMPPMPPAEP